MTSKSDPSSTWGNGAPGRASDTQNLIAQIYRAEWGRLLSILVARTRRLDLAEDALSEAFARASALWPNGGIPSNPSGWLYTTANRLILGGLRGEGIRGRKAPLLAVRPGWEQPAELDDLEKLGDERLALILLCCHPALHSQARSPLALRLVIGTSTEEIARLFLVPKATMAARITRAKKKIVAAGIPLSLPVNDELNLRLDDVCRTIYLAFTAGYAPGTGPDLLRTDVANEAVELAAVLHELVPKSPQVQALNGLLLLQHGRRNARVSDGRLVTLGNQDRSLWNQDELRLGAQLITTLSPGLGYAEELRLQGLLAVEHAQASTTEATNWSAIAELYAQLETLTGSAVVRLNRAVAVAEVDGPQAGLALLSDLDQALPGNHRLLAVRANLAQRSGNLQLARTSYTDAITLCANQVERAYLSEQLAALKS